MLGGKLDILQVTWESKAPHMVPLPLHSLTYKHKEQLLVLQVQPQDPGHSQDSCCENDLASHLSAMITFSTSRGKGFIHVDILDTCKSDTVDQTDSLTSHKTTWEEYLQIQGKINHPFIYHYLLVFYPLATVIFSLKCPTWGIACIVRSDILQDFLPAHWKEVQMFFVTKVKN